MRYGHRMANRGVESAIGFGVAAALRQDPRYFRKPNAGIKARMGNAFSQAVVTHTDSGAKTFAEAAREAGMTEEAMKKAAQRMRRRYHQLFRDEIAQTVATPGEVEEELRHLCAVLSS